MGIVEDIVCCVNKEDIIKKEKLNDSFERTSSFPISNIKTLPSSEIKVHTMKNQIKVNSLSNLPISTLNVIRKKEGDPLSNYEVIKTLGNGTYGNVYKVIHKTTGNVRAMKIIPKNNLKAGFTESEIETEITILKNLDHPKIIKIYEFYNDNDNYYLINEYCSEGDLAEKLHLMKFFPECIVKVLMFQIFSAVAYLHSRRIFHGDLKLENIMIDSSLPSSGQKKERKNSFISSIKEDAQSINENFMRSHTVSFDQREGIEINPNQNILIKSPEKKKLKYSKMKNFDLKLIDFGCSKIFTKYKSDFEDVIGTLLYCSPEVLKNNYNEKCDIWSCGVIMYALLSGDFPFIGKNEKEVIQKILNGKLEFTSPQFFSVSDQAKDLIEKCLEYNKNKRISITDALKHPFFTEDLDPLNIFQENIDNKEVLYQLKSFSKQSKFYQAVLAFLSHNFAGKDYLDRLKKIFFSIDLNLDGKISRDELLYAYRSSGIDIEENQIQEIMESIDFDNNGFIEYEEFIRVTLPKKHLFKEENLKTAFDLFDLDKNGRISLNELKEVLSLGGNVEESVIRELMKEIQQSDKEDITFKKFKKIMMSFDKTENDSIKYCYSQDTNSSTFN